MVPTRKKNAKKGRNEMIETKSFLSQYSNATPAQFTGPPSNVFSSTEDKKAVVAHTVGCLVNGLASRDSSSNPSAFFDEGRFTQ